MIKRLFDWIASGFGILFLLPLFVVLALAVKIGSKGPVFYIQQRVGRNKREFGLFKFRTMYTGSDLKGLITVGAKDNRITPTGYFLRKYKLDELPQLLNVFLGDMSIVGPRPEVKKYVDMYNLEQEKVLLVRPGLTDYASLSYFDENEILGKAEDPDKTYIQEIMPAKLALNLKYINEQSLWIDLKVIFQTLLKIIH